MDLLSNVLRDLRLEGAVLSMGEFLAPWGIDKGSIGAAPFHIILEGRCLLETEGRAPVELAAGDLIVLPHGSRHALFSDREAERTPFCRVLKINGIDPVWRPGKRVRALDHIRFGGSGSVTRLITGVFAFHDRRRNPIVEALPTLIHVQGRMGRGPTWLENSLGLLIDELTLGRPGFQSIVERVADVLFVQAVRDHIAKTPAKGSGWLRGLADPQISKALSLVHAEPGEAWTVASLAKAVGLSRTVFAKRFRMLVGSTVMDYVSSRRMHVAAGMLMMSGDALAEIADVVGYESDISFSRAFRSWAGVPPGQYRRQMAATSST